MAQTLKQITTIFFALFAIQLCIAQTFTSKAEQLSTDEGLSHNRVISIQKDSFGEMWFGTLEGLNRYNSNDFEVLKRNQGDSAGLSSDLIYSILEFPEKTLRLGTVGGVYQLNLKNRTLKPLQQSLIDKAEGKIIYASSTDRKQNIYFGTDNGFFIYNIESEKITNIKVESAENIAVYALHFQSDTLWIGSEHGLFIYLTKKSKLLHISEILTTQKKQISGTEVFAIAADEFGNLIVGHDNGISKITIKNGIFTLRNFDETKLNLNRKLLSVRTISRIQDNEFFIGSNGAGACIFDSKTEQFRTEPVFEYFSDKQIMSSFWDENHALWVGTLRNGVVKIVKKDDIFSSHHIISKDGEELGVFSALADTKSAEILWLGTNMALAKYNISAKTYSLFSPFDRTELKHTMIALAEAGKNILVTTYGSGIYEFNKSTGAFKKHAELNAIFENLPVFSIYKQNEEVLILSAGQHFVLYNFKSRQIIHKKIEAHKMQRVYTMYPISESKLLLGGYYGGLQILDLKDFSLKTLNLNTKPLTAVFNIYPKNDTIFWLNTYDTGICEYNLVTNTISDILDLKLPNVATFTILSGKHSNRLWMSSNDGLWSHNISENESFRFSKSDGLQDTEFNAGAALRLSDGRLLFGGIRGFNIINEDTVKLTNSEIPLKLTRLKIRNIEIKPLVKYGKKIILAQEIDLIDTLFLEYKESSFSVDFAAIDYIHSKELKYRYKLENFDSEWYLTKAPNRTAVYTNLSPGIYTFILQVADKHGRWLPKTKQLTIVIEPPFWQTNWFYIICIIFILSSIYLFTYLRNRVLLREKTRLEAQVAQRTAEIEHANNALKSEIEFSESVIHEAYDGIIVLKTDGSFVRTNPAFLKITAYSASEIAELNIKKIIHTVDFKLFEQLIARANSGEKNESEIRVVTKSGKIIYTRISSAFFSKNAVICVISDISQRKAMERELRKHRQLLEIEVEARTSALKKEKEKAEASDRLKSAFLANMSHEIRTPLNAVLGYAQLLEMPDLTDEQRSEYAKMINFGGETLLQLISDIIDIAKIEADEMSAEPEQIKLNPVLSNIHASFLTSKSNYEKANVELILDIPDEISTIYADKLRFKQIFINLISNALKFTDLGFVKMGYIPPRFDDTFITFYVQDTGIGIPEENLSDIFERFRKLDNIQARLHRGTGLGLAISKRLVEMHGGRIWTESQVGIGSVFFFTLPTTNISQSE